MKWSYWLPCILALSLVGCSLAPGVITVRASMGTYSIKFDSEVRIRSALIVNINNTRPPLAGTTYRLSVTGPGYSTAREYTITQTTSGVARGWFGNDLDTDFKDGRFAVTAALNNNQFASSTTSEVKRSSVLEPPSLVLDLAKSSDSQIVANWAGPSGRGVPGAVYYYVRLNKFTDNDSIEMVKDFPTRSISVNFNGLSLEEGPRYFLSINAFNTDVFPDESWNPLPDQFNISYANSMVFTIKNNRIQQLGLAPQVLVE